MKTNTKEDLIELFGDELIFMDGFNDCIHGVVNQFGRPPIVCYDLNKVIDQLKVDGMTDEEAYEWHEYNQLGAYVGESTPCFITI